MRRQINRPIPDWSEKVAVLVGAIVSWIMFGMLYRFATAGAFIFTSILIGPCVLLLTYFAFGGDIPLTWRRKGYHRIMMVGPVFFISFLAVVIVIHRIPEFLE